MKTIDSRLTGVQGTFGIVRDTLSAEEFSLANWEYDGGYFDRKLDDKGMVYLRLPIEVQEGQLDAPEARIVFGTPFVLKHVYQTGIEENIGYYASQYLAPVMNQFQEPVDKDAEVGQEWVDKASDILRYIEPKLL